MDNQGGPRGGCCSLIVLALAVIGAFQVYQYFAEPSGCEGATQWVETSDELFTEIERQGRALNPQTSSQADVLAYIDLLRDATRTQLESSPPQVGERLNGEWAAYYAMIADSFEALIRGQEPPYSESELLLRGTEILELRDDFNETCS